VFFFEKKEPKNFCLFGIAQANPIPHRHCAPPLGGKATQGLNAPIRMSLLQTLSLLCSRKILATASIATSAEHTNHLFSESALRGFPVLHDLCC
jgi:hypothetical protein